MTGVVMGAAAAGGPTGFSGTPGTIAWGNINAVSGGATNLVTLSGITGAITVSAAITGGAALSYTLNGVNRPYSGAFQWPEGQALGWTVIGPGTGTVTVTSEGSTLDSFTYLIVPPGIVSLGEIE
ncbi:MAG TPA: hypothetical protein VGH03_17850 [Caulobacteraceae bacterium]|jgi:hypothetical protein